MRTASFADAASFTRAVIFSPNSSTLASMPLTASSAHDSYTTLKRSASLMPTPDRNTFFDSVSPTTTECTSTFFTYANFTSRFTSARSTYSLPPKRKQAFIRPYSEKYSSASPVARFTGNASTGVCVHCAPLAAGM